MSTPVAHALAGATCGIAVHASGPAWKRAVAGGVLGASADLDFVPGLLVGDPSRFHHTVTHSLGFTLLIVLLVLGTAVARTDRASWALLAFAAYGSHLLLDFFTMDLSTPRGIPLLWPVATETFQSPVALLPRVLHSEHGVLNLHNLLLAVGELIAFGALLLATVAIRRSAATGGHGS